MRIKLCAVRVRDAAEAFRFYTETLGFYELMTVPEHHLYIVASPEDPDGVSLLLEPTDNPIGSAYMNGLYENDMPAIVFGAVDVQAEYERLSALGVRFPLPPTTDVSGTTAVFDDTCGNLIQLHQD